MKSQLLSIFSGATDQAAVPEITAESQPEFSSYHARYQAFLNRQTSSFDSKSHRSANPIRVLQGVFSFAIFVAMFLTILTLVGFWLSSLGVIAQVSPSAMSASGKTAETMKTVPTAPASPKKKSKRQ